MSTPTWQPLPPLRATDSVTALAASQGVAFAGNAAGVFKRSANTAWARLELTATEVQALAFGDSPEKVVAGSGSMVNVSQDGGETWSRSEIETEARITSLSWSGKTILAGTDKNGIFLSLDEGASWRSAGLQDQMVLAVCGGLAGTEQGLWQLMGGPPAAGSEPNWQKNQIDDVVTAIAQSGDTIVAGTEKSGLLRSTDSGKSWSVCAKTNEGVNAVACSADRFVAATSVGEVLVSENRGETWREVAHLPAAVVALATGGETILAGCYREGCFEYRAGQWQPFNTGLESANVLDILADGPGLLAVVADSVRRLRGDAWETVDPGAAGDLRAAALTPAGQLVVATTEGLFEEARKVKELTDVTLLRYAQNGDLAALTADTLHLRLAQKWTQTPLSSRERVIGMSFSPSYPDDDSLLLATVRQGTRTSVVRYGPQSGDMDRLFDYDAGSRWLGFALPPGSRVDSRRPAAFFVGTGRSLFRPAWPGDNWQRDILHDENAMVLSIAVSPDFDRERTVLVGTTMGAVITHNGGLLWTNLNDGLGDRRCLKVVFESPDVMYCLTPTKVWRMDCGEGQSR